MNARVSPVTRDDFRSVRDEAIRAVYVSGVRLKTIAGFFGMHTSRIAQLATPAMRAARRAEVERREMAIIANRLGEMKLRMAAEAAFEKVGSR